MFWSERSYEASSTCKFHTVDEESALCRLVLNAANQGDSDNGGGNSTERENSEARIGNGNVYG